MAYVGIFFAMLAVTAVSSVMLVIFIDGLLHLMISLSPKRLRKNGWRPEKHGKPWTARLARELRLLLDPREHVGAGLGGSSSLSIPYYGN